MKVWLIQTSEPLPLDNSVKKMRTAMLADKLVEKGHSVLWWTSAFDHYSKSWFFETDKRQKIYDNYEIYAIKGKGYEKNISLKRFSDHRLLARRFRELSEKEEKPDIILASSPPYDFAYEAVKYGNKHNIPVIVDIRDEWPEIFLNLSPRGLKWLLKLLLFKEFNMFKKTMRNSYAITSMSESMLKYGLKYANRQKKPEDEIYYIGENIKKYDTEIPPKVKFIENLKNKFIVTFMGTFVSNQNPMFLVECAKRVNNEDIVFIFAGDGEYFNKVSKAVEDMPNVVLTGWLNELEIHHLLMNSHVGLAPVMQYRETFGNKFFTYASRNLPIITSVQGELKDIILKQNIGCYFPPGDVNAISECILKLFNDRESHKTMCKNIERIFPAMFDANNIYSEFASYLENITNKYNQK